jgi:hypothetical protein
MRLIIGRLTPANWIAHLVLILAAAAAAAGLASAEGDMLRKVITVFLIVLVLMLIAQVPVEQRPPEGRVSYGFPYAICAAASILMLVGTSVTSDWLLARVIQVSALLFAIGGLVFAFQVQGLLRSA